MQEWVNTIDRGGLTKFTTEVYFNAIEMCVRRNLTVSGTENFQIDLMLNDNNVLFY